MRLIKGTFIDPNTMRIGVRIVDNSRSKEPKLPETDAGRIERERREEEEFDRISEEYFRKCEEEDRTRAANQPPSYSNSYSPQSSPRRSRQVPQDLQDLIMFGVALFFIWIALLIFM